MTMGCRGWVAALAAAAMGAWTGGGIAQVPDAKTNRIVVPAPPGGNLDASARMLALRLARVTGETFLVDNRPGANTQIGTELVAHSPPDGRTLLFTGTGLVFLPLLQKLSFSPQDELAPVVQTSIEHYVLVVTADSPLAGAADIAAAAAARPGGLNCAAYPGVSTLACEQLRLRLGGKVTTVPFPGIGPALTTVLGGHADLLFVNVEPASKLVQGGRLKVLAQTPGAGAAVGSQAPAFHDLWPGFLLEGHAGVYVPAGTPQSRIAQLNRDINRVLAEPEVQALMREGGQEPVGGPPQRFADMLKLAQQRYGDMIRRLGLVPK